MADKKFDPKKFVNREFEQELFEELLRFKDHARVLAIRDSGGAGKTQLLEKFRYRCSTVKPRTPVTFIPFDQQPDMINPLALIKAIEKDLAPFGVKFSEFQKFDTARRSGNFTEILSSVYLQEAKFQGARDLKIAAYQQNIGHAGTVIQGTVVGTLTPEQQETADNVCARAFFDDLKRYCAEKGPVVFLFDAYDKCADELKKWIMDGLLATYCFDLENRPERLVLVLAGEDIPEFDLQWPQEDCDMIVRSVKELAKWKREHVEECLRFHGLEYTSEQVTSFYGLIQMGFRPSDVVALVETMIRRRQ